MRNTSDETAVTFPQEGSFASGADASKSIRRWDSKALFGGSKELLIMHAGSEYRLRLTSLGKLVLTK
jgi:hemin uptake protein HemP